MNVILDKIYTELKRLKKVSSKGDFADRLSYNRTYISEIMNSETKELPDKLQASLQTVFGVNPKFIETGEGEMFTETPNKVSEMAAKGFPRPNKFTRLLNLDAWLKAERTEQEIKNMAELIKKLDEEK